LTHDNLLTDDINETDTSTHTDEAPRYVLQQKYIDMMAQYHETFFGKQEVTVKIRFGLLSYQMNGAEQIKSILTKAMALSTTSMSLILRDLPIYEIRIKSADESSAQTAKNVIINFLKEQTGVVFRELQ
jgi:translation initiation factor 2 alpha subunit (eIF-2alpha)